MMDNFEYFDMIKNLEKGTFVRPTRTIPADLIRGGKTRLKSKTRIRVELIGSCMYGMAEIDDRLVKVRIDPDYYLYLEVE